MGVDEHNEHKASNFDVKNCLDMAGVACSMVDEVMTSSVTETHQLW